MQCGVVVVSAWCTWSSDEGWHLWATLVLPLLTPFSAAVMPRPVMSKSHGVRGIKQGGDPPVRLSYALETVHLGATIYNNLRLRDE